MVSDAMLLLPRPYPDFQPLMFRSANAGPMRIADIEKVEIQIGQASTSEEENRPIGLWLEYVGLKK